MAHPYYQSALLDIFLRKRPRYFISSPLPFSFSSNGRHAFGGIPYSVHSIGIACRDMRQDEKKKKPQ
jgi:hypothetical protein